MTSLTLRAEDVEAPMGFVEGGTYKYFYRKHFANKASKIFSRTVKVVKEYPKFILLDFGHYLGTVHKVDLLIGRAVLK